MSFSVSVIKSMLSLWYSFYIAPNQVHPAIRKTKCILFIYFLWTRDVLKSIPYLFFSDWSCCYMNWWILIRKFMRYLNCTLYASLHGLIQRFDVMFTGFFMLMPCSAWQPVCNEFLKIMVHLKVWHWLFSVLNSIIFV